MNVWTKRLLFVVVPTCVANAVYAAAFHPPLWFLFPQVVLLGVGLDVASKRLFPK